ncbi:hypothetical protein A1O3_00636 [Capronia epimyces CBS 606.96]|uniref:Uncharacterized protein n=1 Tax=Capronia epimyces CBS 606.96 TaxID=1182542 RepID=W9YS44_9EURO|nr:uncharacterized protein A1O3_00636 [Capronia epimyces CBS 606.96]EXJ92086.1 hypothetical protein A1O3_00636 [Capronia epimyces CBS 606.96]
MAVFHIPTVLLALLFGLGVLSTAQSNCGTDQNPYCAGNSLLEQLCCPYPNVCYWQDRDGAPGCCPAGQACNGQTYVPPSTIHPTTVTITSTSKSTPTPTLRSTITSYVNGGGGVIVTSQPSVITVTTDNWASEVYSTVTSGVVGVYSTVTSVVGGVYSTVTSDVGQGFATVSGVLVSGTPSSHFITILSPVMAVLFSLTWVYAG